MLGPRVPIALTNEQRRQDNPASNFDTGLLLACLASWPGAKQDNADAYRRAKVRASSIEIPSWLDYRGWPAA
jgi:hypothetical protein